MRALGDNDSDVNEDRMLGRAELLRRQAAARQALFFVGLLEARTRQAGVVRNEWYSAYGGDMRGQLACEWWVNLATPYHVRDEKA